MKAISEEQFKEGRDEELWIDIYNSLHDAYTKEEIERVLNPILDEMEVYSHTTMVYAKNIRQELAKLGKVDEE